MKVVLVIALVMLGGCSSFQESHYSNTSTPEGNVVVATGRAADVAAAANTTHNCPSCSQEQLDGTVKVSRPLLEQIGESVIIQSLRSGLLVF